MRSGRVGPTCAGLVGVVLVALTACGSGDEGATTGRGVRSAPSPTVVGDTAARVTHLRQRLRSKIPTPNGDGITAAGDSIWVKTDDGRLIRIDPTTNKVRSTLRLDTPGLENRYCQGVGTDGDSVWTCATRARKTPVVRVDPTTGREAETFAVDKSFDQLTMPYAFGRVWVLTGDGSSLVGLKPGQPRPDELSLGARCAQVSPTEHDLVLTCPLDDSVRRVDPDTGKTLARSTIRHPFIASSAGNDVWIGSTDGLQRLDAHSLRPTAVYPRLSPELAGDIVAGKDEVWVRIKGGFLYRIDPRTGAVTEQITAPGGLSGGSLLVTADSLWTTASDDGVLLRVSR